MEEKEARVKEIEKDNIKAKSKVGRRKIMLMFFLVTCLEVGTHQRLRKATLRPRGGRCGEHYGPGGVVHNIANVRAICPVGQWDADL